MHVHPDKVRTARKSHQCSCCAVRIQPGERYVYRSGVEDSYWHMKLHPYCEEQFGKMLRDYALESEGSTDPYGDVYEWRRDLWEHAAWVSGRTRPSDENTSATSVGSSSGSTAPTAVSVAAPA